MQRRQFLTGGLAGAGTGAFLASPAIAQTAPEIHWRLASSFPANLDILYGGADVFSRAVSDATDGRFTIEIHPAGEIVGPLDVFDAVKRGDIDCAQTAMHYHWGEEPALVFATGVPFSMNARQQNSFFRNGGGTDLFNEILVDHQIYALPAGNTGCQMGGFFRKELAGVDDFKNLKFRITGLAGKVLEKIGAVPTASTRSEMAGALASGALDAAAWVSPYDDEKLGLIKAAPYYYYPGWWLGSMAVHIAINLKKWNDLPKPYQAVVRGAAELANSDMMAKYDGLNPAALKRLVSAGAKLQPFPQDALEACYQAANDVFSELAESDAKFKNAYEATTAYRNDEYLWWQVAEYPFDNFLIRERAKG
jgi:TRAP-type mannitol/chloroaromatic compound transport system substrate-binding protein